MTEGMTARLVVDLEQGVIRPGPRLLGERVRVLIVGAGGTGSEMVDSIVRLDHTLHALGGGRFSIIIQDDDTVSQFNIGRQRFAVSDIGQPKASVLACRYRMAYGTDIRAMNTRATRRHISEFGSFDVVITCADNAAFRVQVCDAWARKASNTIWVDAGNDLDRGQLVIGHLGRLRPGEVALPNVVALFPEIRSARDDRTPSCSMAEAMRRQSLFVNRWVADLAGSMFYRLFREGSLDHSAALMDMRSLQIRPIPVNREVWKGMADMAPASSSGRIPRGSTVTKRRRNGSTR